MTPSDAIAAWEEGMISPSRAIDTLLPEILECNRRIAAQEAQRAILRGHLERVMRDSDLPTITLLGHTLTVREASRWQAYDRAALNALAAADPRLAPAIRSCLVWQERAGGLEIRRER